nr:uncharacterized protein LOC116652330 [Drosophila virilis]
MTSTESWESKKKKWNSSNISISVTKLNRCHRSRLSLQMLKEVNMNKTLKLDTLKSYNNNQLYANEAQDFRYMTADNHSSCGRRTSGRSERSYKSKTLLHRIRGRV